METTARRTSIPDIRTEAGPLNNDSARRVVTIPTGPTRAPSWSFRNRDLFQTGAVVEGADLLFGENEPVPRVAA